MNLVDLSELSVFTVEDPIRLIWRDVRLVASASIFLMGVALVLR
jgi:hypothetical protein